MATIRICDNIFEKDSLRTVFASKGEFRQVKDAVLALCGSDAYEGQLVECWNPDTDETTWEPMNDSSQLSVSVIINGTEADINSEICESDEILIMVLPSGGREAWQALGAVIGVVIGVALAAFTGGASLYAGAGGLAGMATVAAGAGWGSVLLAGAAYHIGTTILYALGGAIAGAALAGAIYDAANGGANSKDPNKNLEGKNYPGVKGSKNQSLLDKNYPFILGKHLFTPPFVAAPYSRSDGRLGEKQSISLAYAAGYAPLRLTEFRLGELLLAYNKKTVKNPACPTIMCGKFKKPGVNSNKVYQWRDATENEINMLIAGGKLKFTTETYVYLADDDSATRGGLYTTYRERKIGTRSYYVSLSNEVRVLDVTLYDKGRVQYYSADATEEEQDTGEILHCWINNDIELEILQQNPNGAANWGTVVTQAVSQDEINATPLYVCDELLGGVAAEQGVTYKGCLFDNGFRNNTVRFSRSYPMKLELELEATNGLYRTYQYSSSRVSRTVYEYIPCWYAIQWRPYNSGAQYSFAENWRKNDDNPWRTFEHINQYTANGTTVTPLVPMVYTQELHDADILAHTGNKNIMDASRGWIGCKLFDLGALVNAVGGTDKDRISMQRFTAVVDLSTSKPSLDANAPSPYGGADYLRDSILNLNSDTSLGSNTNGKIEVRVIRVSPCYLNETESLNTNYSAKQYCDIVKWNSLTTFMFDKEALEKDENYSLVPQKIMKESELRKLCVVALRAQADTGGNIQNQLGKFNFIAESFSPTFAEIDDNGTKRVVIQPENITKRMAYYKPAAYDSETKKFDSIDTANPITKEEYEELRQNNVPAIKRKMGNNYTETILNEIFSAPADQDGRVLLTKEIKDKYVDNNSASSAMLALLGKQNGIDALGYEDLNLDSFAEMYNFCKAVVDGSTYPVDETVFDDDLSTKFYRKGDPIEIKYSCNACVSNAVKVETLFQKCLATGRAIFFRDENNKIKVTVDDEKEYPVMLINQQNVISGSNFIGYESLPAGLQFSFEDEQDGFTGHTLYTMNDGEDSERPTKEIESFPIEFVTNRHQLWSLGRYVLASRNLQRETLQRKIGPEGFCAELGDLVKVADDTLLIGTDLGARVKEIIEDFDYIYGVVTDETYKYTGETETKVERGEDIPERSVQGAEFLQPTKYKAARVVTYRCALPNSQITLNRVVIDGNIYSTDGTITVDGVRYNWIDNTEEKKYFDGHYYEKYFDIDGEIYPVYEKTYKMKVGDTNVMLFDKPVAKSGAYAGSKVDDGESQAEVDAQLTYYKPEIDDIVAFGKVGKTTALYTIVKIKPDKDYNFDLTLAQYNTQTYMAGLSIPKFENNMSIPDRSGEDNYPLSESLTPVEMQRVVASNAKMVVQLLSSGEAEIDAPDAPTMTMCKADRDGIALKCVKGGEGARNSITRVQWQVAKEQSVAPSEIVWDTNLPSVSDLPATSDLSTTYTFDRSVDGFPEAKYVDGWYGIRVLNDVGSKWYFRARVVNAYGKASEWSEPLDVDTRAYGTWLVGDPDRITDRVSGRTVTLAFDQKTEAEKRKPLYGDVYYSIEIRRYDSKTDGWYDPADDEDPYTSENNYRNGGDEAEPNEEPSDASGWPQYILDRKRTSHSFTQTLPLQGQNDQLYQYQWHYFREPASDNDPYARLDFFGEPRKEGAGTAFSATPPDADWDSVTKVFGDDNNEHMLPGYFNDEREGRVHGMLGETGEDEIPVDIYRYGNKEEIYELIKDNGQDYSRAFHNGEYAEISNGSFTLDGIVWTISGNKVTNDYGPEEDDIFSATKVLSYTLVDGMNPVDTPYQYRVRAFNVWGDDFVHYSGAKVFTVSALATGVRDLVEGAVTHNKLAEGAVWVDNLAAGSITAEKMAVKDLMAITGVFGKIQNNLLKSSAYNYWDLETGEFLIGNEAAIDPDSDNAEYIKFTPADPLVPRSVGSLAIKIANFIVKAITSIIQGVFIIRSKLDSNKRVLMVANPEASSQSDCPARTVKINGDFNVTGTMTGLKSLTIKQTLGGQSSTDTYDGSVDKEITIEGYNQSLNTSDNVKFSSISFSGHSGELSVSRMRLDGSTLYINC